MVAQHVKKLCTREQSLSPEGNWAPITRDSSYKLGSIQTGIHRIKNYLTRVLIYKRPLQIYGILAIYICPCAISINNEDHLGIQNREIKRT